MSQNELKSKLNQQNNFSVSPLNNKLTAKSPIRIPLNDNLCRLKNMAHSMLEDRSNFKIDLAKMKTGIEVEPRVENNDLEEFTLLKRQELQNIETLDELTRLKNGLEEMKEKQLNHEYEKIRLEAKNKQLELERKELNEKIALLKQNYVKNSVDEKVIESLRKQIQCWKSKAIQMQDVEGSLVQMENKCKAVERTAQQYTLKFHTSQNELNEAHLSIYRLKKECDDLRINNQIIDHEKQDIQSILEKERSHHRKQTHEWEAKVKKLQMEKSEILCKFEQISISGLESENYYREIESLKIEKKGMSQKIQHLESEIRAKVEFDKLMAMKESQHHEMIKMMTESHEEESGKKIGYIKKLEQKSTELLRENERINNVFGEYRNEQEEERKRIKLETQQNLKQLEEELKRILQILDSKDNEIVKLKKNQNELMESVAKYDSCLKEKEAEAEELSTKLTKMEVCLRNEKGELGKEVKRKENQIQKLDIIINQTNKELKEIKEVLGNYKGKIRELNSYIEEADLRTESEELERKKMEEAYSEEVKYYKARYEDSCQQNSEMGEKIYQIQRENTEQINKCTDYMRLNHHLQDELKVKQNSWTEFENKIQEQLDCLYKQNKKLKNKCTELEQIKSGMSHNLSALEISYREAKQKLILKQQELTQAQTQFQQQKQSEIHLLSQEIAKSKEQFEVTLANKQMKVREECRNQSESMRRQCEAKLEQMRREVRRHCEEVISLRDVLRMKEEELERNSEKNEKQDRIKNEEIRNLQLRIEELNQRETELGHENHKRSEEVNGLYQQNNANKATLKHLQLVINSLQNKNVQLGNEIFHLNEKLKEEREDRNYEIMILKGKISGLEEKLQFQLEESSLWMRKFEEANNSCIEVKNQWHSLSECYMEEKNKKTKDNLREVEILRAQLELSEEERTHMKKFLEEELKKRKDIIEELIQEKQILYEQIRNH